MTATTHTPTPWDAQGRGHSAWIYSVANKHNVAEIGSITPEDAAHIVACVNAHDALTARVAELEAALRDLEYAVSGNHALHGLPNFQRARDNASAALAKVAP